MIPKIKLFYKAQMKKIAIIGRPNVGKSSLFNRLAKERIAITSDIKGTTRDTKETTVLISGNEVMIIDTGGIERTKDELFSKVAKNALNCAKQSDLVLYLTDGKEIPNDEDKALIHQISQIVPCFVVVNKIDNDAQKEFGYAFYGFGIKDVFFISVLHNRGISILLDSIANALFSQNLKSDEEDLLENLESMLESKNAKSSLDSKDFTESSGRDFEILESNAKDSNNLESTESSVDNVIHIGIIGRVNVGKSSLLNALVDKERSIVSEVAGTTIDPVDEQILLGDYVLHFVDTAGIRRRGKIEGIEKFALDRTNKALQKADIAILVLDSSEEFCELDEKITSLIQKHQLGVIVVFNKWDIKRADFKGIKAEFLQRFRFLEWVPFLTISAKNKRHIRELKQKILEVYKNYSFRIQTSRLNESITNAVRLHPIPSDRGKLVKIYYATQYETKPPQIALISNRAQAIHFSYKRFLVNQLRKEFNLFGTPIILAAKSKTESIKE